MNSDQTQTLESSIPRRGRPPRKSSPQKTKSNGIRKPRPRAVKLSANLQTADSNLTKVANKSSEIGKNFPIASAKDSPPITTFILTTTNGKTSPLTPLSKSGSQPMNRVQYATSADTNSIKQVPIAVSSNILSRVQSSTSTGSSPKLLLITTANNSTVSVPTTSANQTLCNTLLPVKLSNSTCNMNAVVAGNLRKPVLYQIPSSQSSGMVLVGSTVPLQSGVAPKNFFLIPSSTNTKRQSNASQISYSGVDCQPVIPIQTTSINHSPIDINKILNTSVPITSNLAETTSTNLTQQSSVNNNRPTKRVNTSRRRGSIHGANSTISSIPSGIFKTVASTTNSRGICSTPVSIQISPKQSNVKITPVGGLVPLNPLLGLPMQQTSTHLTQDVFLNVTTPTVPEVSLKSNHLFAQSSDNNCCNSSSSSSSISTVNTCTISKTLSDSKQQTTGRKLRKPSKRSQAISGQRAKKTTSKIGQNKELSSSSSSSSSSSLITVSSSLPFSTIQLKMNCSTTPTSPFSGLSWVVSPNTGHQQQKSSLNSETQTNMPKKSKNMPKLIVVNGFSNSNFPTIPSTNSQTSKNDYQDGFFSASQYPKCSEDTQPLYASPPKLTIAPGFSTPDQTGSESAKKKRPSELLIIKEREEFIDDSVELSPPKLQREEGTDLSGKFLFEMPTTIESAKLAEGKSIDDELASALAITNQSQQFCHEIKPIIREDNFPTLANLLARQNSKCSEFSSRLEQNKKLSFDQLFNHFKLLADKKKKSSSHSAIMFQVAYSIHCCVVLAKIDEDSVDVPFCAENLKCSVKCRQTFMKEVFAQKGISSLVDPRFSMSVLQSSDSTNDEWLAQCHQSKSTNNLLSVNENISFSSSAMPELSKIKVEFPESKKNSPDDQENLTNSVATKQIATLPSYASSTPKLATHIEEPFTSSNSISAFSDNKCLKQCTQKPENVTSTNVNQPIHSLLSDDCSDTSTCTSSRTRTQNKGKCFCNGKCKKTDSSICLSQQKIKNVCSDTIQSSDILNVLSHSTNSQVLAGKLRYKIVPKGHISLSGKSSENESNCVGNPKEKRKFSVQSYIINGDKSSINPTQTISPVVAPSVELYNAETKKLIGSNFDRKKKRTLPSPLKLSEENTEKKKICKSKMVAVPPMIKSAKASKERYSRSSPSVKASLPLVERPFFVRDPKHLYDEPTTVDRVVMLTPDGKPILTGIDLQTLDPCLPSPKKRKKSSKREFPVKSSPTKQRSSSSCSIFKKSSSVKNKVQGKHSKSSSANDQVSRPPKLHVLLRELEQKCKYKYLSCSPPMTNSTQMNDSIFHQKTKKGKIEQIVTNIASGFPAFGSGHPRCTMKLYKYFVSSRLKNRAKKDGSHEMDAPLILYINWKTLSRQPFSKHRITNHTQNIMAIKNSKQLANFKKCKSRRQMCQPVKNKPLFMKRRKALLAVRNKKTKTNPNKLKQQTNKKYSRCLQSQSNKTKKQKIKTLSSKKKVSVLKLDKTVLSKTEKADNNIELVPIAEKKKSKIDVIKNKTLKSAEKKFKVPQLKQNKQVNKKEMKKKCSSLPVQRSTRLRNCDSEKIASFCEDPNKIEKQSENHVVKKGLRRKAKLKPPEIWTKEMNKCKPLYHLNDEDLSLRMKSADLTVEKEKLVDIKQEIKSETDIQETKSVTEMEVSQLTRVKSNDPSHQERQTDGKNSSSSKSVHHSKKTHEEVFSEKGNANSDQALLLASINDPVDENAKVVTLKQSSSPTITEDSGNFIFEDDVEPSLPTIDNSSMLCNENKPLNSLHNSLSVNNDQPAISNRNLSTSFINVTPASGRSSAFSDKFDIGLSPELARIQKLKDQLQEKQKALDLAKFYLK